MTVTLGPTARRSFCFLAVLLSSLAGAASLAAAAPPTLNDYWAGNKAEFKLAFKVDQASVPGSPNQLAQGSHITVDPINPNTWYLFSRQIVAAPAGADCDPDVNVTGTFAIGIKVWKSMSKGAPGSWTGPTSVVNPVAGTPFACFAGDGDAYYDAASQTWHYLAQCYGSFGNSTYPPWLGCHWTHSGADPTSGGGPWTADPQNPVIADTGTGKQLWQRICVTGTFCKSDTTGVVGSAGTFTIFDAPNLDPGYHYIRFHGQASAPPPGDPQNILPDPNNPSAPIGNLHQFTGIAKTTDFHTFLVATDPGSPTHLPGDSIFDARRPKGFAGFPAWRESRWTTSNIIGGGGGDVFYDSTTNLYYLVTDASDRTQCGRPQPPDPRPDITIDLGIYRTDDPVNTVWAAFPAPHQNPIVFGDVQQSDNPRLSLCDPAYGKLFKDPTNGQIYLAYGKEINRFKVGHEGDPTSTAAETDPSRTGLYIYALSWNLLRNGDFSDATGTPWQPWNAAVNQTAIGAFRDSYRGSDGNGYLGANCGGNGCQPDEGFYQDVSIAGQGLTNFKFGGKFASYAGQAGSAYVFVQQLSATGALITQNYLPVSFGGNTYTSVESPTIPISTNLQTPTTTLRYIVFLTGIGATDALKVDETFINPYP